ncbi:MAG: hypothetical protein CMH64_04010 [Nanoarchaeota archaeon]|nr:hypothetical protein [Nanoarchaeota archaeon]|tara:strand:+ start:441 stop:998 length:558 start_codon:yes stop_codon:yes gene_type:complete
MLELRRQAFHILLGVGLVVLLNFNIIDLTDLFVVFIFGVIISIFSSRYKIPVIEWFLENFDRKNSKIRGQGVLTCFFGAMVVLLFFEKNIALASILILTLGDSFCHLGKLGKLKYPFSDKRFVEGLIIGIIVATLGALIFVSFLQAFFGSLIAMFVESLDLKIYNVEIDDNILIPLIAGIVMSLI